MNKAKGFTLIELLAIIVILAIIALIAIPITMSIIESSKKSALERTYEGIEKAAHYYVMSEKDGVVENEFLIPMEHLRSYIKGLPQDSAQEYVVVKNLGDDIQYYYTGRDKNPYNTNPELRVLMEEESNHIVKNTTVNGRVVNKVIGTRDERNNMKHHVWYSGQLWYVLETNEDGIKLVTAYSIANNSFGLNNNWNTSFIRRWLNDISADMVNYPNVTNYSDTGVFYKSLSRKDLIVPTKSCLDVNNPVEEDIDLVSPGMRTRLKTITPISNCQNSVMDMVAIPSIEDYAYAYDGTLNEYPFASATNIININQRLQGGLMGRNFIDNFETMFFMNPSSVPKRVWGTFYSNEPSFVSKDFTSVPGDGRSIRAVITLKDTVRVYEGNGTRNDPYIIENTKEVTKLIGSNTGEYVYLNEGNNPYETNVQAKEKVLYRIIGNDDNGIKVQRDDILRKLPTTISPNGTAVPFYSYYNTSEPDSMQCYRPSNDIQLYNGCIGQNIFNTNGAGPFVLHTGQNIGYFLNNPINGFITWFPTHMAAQIKMTSWNLTTHSSAYYSYVDQPNQDNPTYPSRVSDGIVNTKIILPFSGNILSGNDNRLPYSFAQRLTGNQTHTLIQNVSGYQNGAQTAYQGFGVRPVFYLNSFVKVVTGIGTKSSPYELLID